MAMKTVEFDAETHVALVLPRELVARAYWFDMESTELSCMCIRQLRDQGVGETYEEPYDCRAKPYPGFTPFPDDEDDD